MKAGPVEPTRLFRARLDSLRPWQRLAGLFLFAFLLRLAYLLEVKDAAFFAVLVGDGAVYDAAAQKIQTDWIGKEVFYQAPLYPYFLAAIYTLFGHELWAVRIIQIGLGAGACVLLALAGRAFFSEGVALIAGFLLAAYGPALYFDGLIQKACLDLFFMTVLLWSLGRITHDSQRRWPLLAGSVLGCLALTRENALILVPIVLAWLGWRWWDAAGQSIQTRQAPPLFLLGIALVLAPVAVRNYAVGGELILTTSQLGANFYIGNNPDADGTYEPLRWGHGSFPLEHQDAVEIAEKAAGKKLTAAEISHYWTVRATSWIRTHPGDWLKLLVRKWSLVWNAREIPDSDEPLVYQDASLILTLCTAMFSFGTIAPLALAGAVATWSDRKRLWILYLTVLGIAAATALFYVFARYRYPIVPVLILFAAAGVMAIVQRVRRRRLRPLLTYGLLVGGAALAVRWNPPRGGDSRAMALYNLGVSLEQRGDIEQAMTNYRGALAADPGFVQAHVNLGALLAGGGQLEEGIAHERAALRLRPEDSMAHANLANALFELGRLDEAEQHYRSALRAEPDLAMAQQGLGALLEERKKRTP